MSDDRASGPTEGDDRTPESTGGDDPPPEASGADGRLEEVPSETRRNVAKYLMGLSGAVAVGSYAVTGLIGLSDGGRAGGNGDGKIWVNGTQLVDKDGNPVTVDALPRGEGEAMTVLPRKEGGGALKKKEATTRLLRFSKGAYSDPTKTAWTVKGYVAYSMVCTHEGCIVSERQNQDLFCPCHASAYDPTEGAVVTAGPAPRPLPQLPIGITENGTIIVATGPFEGPVGPVK